MLWFASRVVYVAVALNLVTKSPVQLRPWPLQLPRSLKTLASAPFWVPTVEPTVSVVPPPVPLNAALIAARVDDADGVPGPLVFIHAMAPPGDNEIGPPQPCDPNDPLTRNEQLAAPMGNMVASCGIPAGGFDTAVARTVIVTDGRPSSARNAVGMLRVIVHCTAFTNAPLFDGVNVRAAPSKIPSATSPAARLTEPPLNGELRLAYVCAVDTAVGNALESKPRPAAPASAAASRMRRSSVSAATMRAVSTARPPIPSMAPSNPTAKRRTSPR